MRKGRNASKTTAHKITRVEDAGPLRRSCLADLILRSECCRKGATFEHDDVSAKLH